MRQTFGLADEVGTGAPFGLGIGHALFLACGKAAHHPDHVAGQVAHGLHAFLVLGCVFGNKAVHGIPVGRASHGHLGDAEVLVEAIKGRACASASGNSNGRAWLELEDRAVAVEGPVQEGKDASARMGVVDRRGKDKAVSCAGLFHKVVDTVVLEDTTAGLTTLAALQTVRQGLCAKLNHLGLDALGFEHGNHFPDGLHGGTILVAAAIHEQDFHDILLKIELLRLPARYRYKMSESVGQDVGSLCAPMEKRYSVLPALFPVSAPRARDMEHTLFAIRA